MGYKLELFVTYLKFIFILRWYGGYVQKLGL